MADLPRRMSIVTNGIHKQKVKVGLISLDIFKAFDLKCPTLA